LAQITTTGAFCLAAYSRRRSRYGLLLFVVQPQRAHGLPGVQVLLHLPQDGHQFRGFLVVAGLRGLGVALQALVDRAQVGQAQLGLDDLDVGHRVDLARDVDDVGIVEAAHHVHHRIGLADVREELVAQPFALARARHQPGNVDKLDDGWHDALRLHDRRQLGQARVRQFDHAHIGLDRAERIVFGGDAGLGQGIEQGGLADVG
jgi:hypothetical protein